VRFDLLNGSVQSIQVCRLFNTQKWQDVTALKFFHPKTPPRFDIKWYYGMYGLPSGHLGGHFHARTAEDGRRISSLLASLVSKYHEWHPMSFSRRDHDPAG
jgi:hypothetical protein